MQQENTSILLNQNTNLSHGNVTLENMTMNGTNRLPCGSSTYTITKVFPLLRLSYQAIVLTLAVIGNICVIIFIKRWKVTSSRMYLFIINLCVADLFVSLFHILPHLVEFAITVNYGNDGWCKLVMYMKMVSLYMSAYIMLATAIDRYREVFHPTTHTIRASHILLIIGWIVPFICSIPQLLNFQMAERKGIIRCRRTAPDEYFKAFLLFFTISIYIVPLLMFIFIYGRLSLVTWRKDRWQQHMDVNGVRYTIQTRGSRSVNDELSESKKKTIQLTFVVVLFYFICWTPFVIAHFWSTYGSAPWCSIGFQMMMLTPSINSCCNPFIYLAFSTKQIKKMLPCVRRRRRHNTRQALYLVRVSSGQKACQQGARKAYRFQ